MMNVRKEKFCDYEKTMLSIFRDANIYDVAMGRALRPRLPAAAGPLRILRRAIYAESNRQVYSLLDRTLNIDNSGSTDGSVVRDGDGHALWGKLVRFNYCISVDNIPNLKRDFFNAVSFRQTQDKTIEDWAAKVRTAASVLAANGHPITESEKILVFRDDLINKTLRAHLIIPARNAFFEDLVQLATTFAEVHEPETPKAFLTTTATTSCPFCLKATGRVLFHVEDECRRKRQTGEHASASSAPASNKRKLDEIECYKCHQTGHYANKCPSSGKSTGKASKSGRNPAYMSYFNPDTEQWMTAPINAALIAASKPVETSPVAVSSTGAPTASLPPASGALAFMSTYAATQQQQGYMVRTQMALSAHCAPHAWIFDTACTSHSTAAFTNFSPMNTGMIAANGGTMRIHGVGRVGSLPNALLVTDIIENLFSMTQSQAEGSTISYSNAGFLVQLRGGGTPMLFRRMGAFYVWDDPLHPKAPRPPQHALALAHTAAVDEFLTCHFRLGHLNYVALYNGFKGGSLTGFHHSLKMVRVAMLPKCPICATSCAHHKRISDIESHAHFWPMHELPEEPHADPVRHARALSPRPGLLFHTDLKTMKVKSIRGFRYFQVFVDDNSSKGWVYFLRTKSDALVHGLMRFVNEVCKPVGIHYFSLRS
jgi:hypothetical protein